jgi:hypothetical protein
MNRADRMGLEWCEVCADSRRTYLRTILQLTAGHGRYGKFCAKSGYKGQQVVAGTAPIENSGDNRRSDIDPGVRSPAQSVERKRETVMRPMTPAKSSDTIGENSFI